MAHKTKINGTTYEVTGGRCLVNGTGYSIKKGTTLINGTKANVFFETPLTWVFNETVTNPAKFLSTIGQWVKFVTAAGEQFQHIMVRFNNAQEGLTPYAVVYAISKREVKAWSEKSHWADEAYRTITFEEPPTGDILTFLWANATPQ